MKKWNPFGKVDMEIGSFLEKSKFNKVYGEGREEDKKSGVKQKNETSDKRGR